ncbi:MAG: phospholipase [Saprospiraceae bacterium]|nr:phospholipase [Saprospiraceae bacterium]
MYKKLTRPRLATIFLLFSLVGINHWSVYSQYDSLVSDGLQRTFLLHLPVGYQGQEAIPLVIAMHGGFGSAENLQDQSGLSEVADNQQFAVVYPEGVKGGLLNIRTWNAGWCCGYSSTTNVDDVGFINTLLDTLLKKYAIDSQRIYATGMSNGGFMSYRLACELSDRIAAIAPVACSMSLSNCEPSRAVPVMHFHSYLDSSVPYQGGFGDGVSDHYNPPLDSVMDQWSVHNVCQSVRDTLVDDDRYTLIQWKNGDCQSEIWQYLTRDGGHSWPGGSKTIIGDPVSEHVNASETMWGFFSQFSLACNLTSASIWKGTNKSRFRLFPNPTSGNINPRHSRSAI